MPAWACLFQGLPEREIRKSKKFAGAVYWASTAPPKGCCIFPWLPLFLSASLFHHFLHVTLSSSVTEMRSESTTTIARGTAEIKASRYEPLSHLTRGLVIQGWSLCCWGYGIVSDQGFHIPASEFSKLFDAVVGGVLRTIREPRSLLFALLTR